MNSSDFESMKKEFGHPPPKRSSNMASSSSSNKFQFKSLNGTTASNANGSSVRGKRCSDVFLVEDDLWCADDGIDDDFLLAASQMAENKKPSQDERNVNGTGLDAEELAEMSRMLEGDDDNCWDDELTETTVTNVELSRPSGSGQNGPAQAAATAKNHEPVPTRDKQRFNQTQTVFLDSGTLGPPETLSTSSTANSTFRKVGISNGLFTKPVVPLSKPKQGAGGDQQGEQLVKLKEELARAKQANKRLTEEKYQANGEILILRSELTKRESFLEREKADNLQALKVKNEELKALEDAKTAKIEAIKAETEFLRQDLRQMKDELKNKRSNNAAASSASSSVMTAFTADVNSAKKRRRVQEELRAANGQMRNGIDESFFEDEPAPPPRRRKESSSSSTVTASEAKLVKKKSVATKETEIQTVRGRSRRGKMELRRNHKSGGVQSALGLVSNIEGGQSSSSRGTARTTLDILASTESGDSNLLSALLRSTDFSSTSRLRVIKALLKEILAKLSSLPKVRRKKRKTRGKRNQRSGELEAEDPDDDNPRVECAKFAGCLRECQELIDCAKVFAELDSLPKDLSIDSDGLALVTDITRKIVTKPEIQYAVGGVYFSFLKSLMRLQALEPREQFPLLLQVFKEYFRDHHQVSIKSPHDKSWDRDRVAAEILDVLTVSSCKEELLGSFCQRSKDSCFIFFLCGSLLNTRTPPILDSVRSPDSQCKLVQSYIGWISTGLSCSKRPLSWIGSLGYKASNGGGNSCLWCRIDVIKTMALLTSHLIRICVDSKIDGTLPPPDTYPTARACVLALHQLWATDNALFVRALGDSPNVQRKYIWTTKHLELLKTSINLSPKDEVETILADLMVDCDDNNMEH